MKNNTFIRAIKNIKRSKFRSTVIIIMMTITFLLSGVLLTVMYSSHLVLNFIAQKPEVIGFFKDDVSEQIKIDLKENMQNKSYIAEVRYVSKDQAMSSFLESNKDNSDLIEGLTANIFPDHLNIKVKNLNDITKAKEDLQLSESIGEIRSPEDNNDNVVETLKKVILTIQIIGISLLSIFTISTIFIILLTIGITVYSQKNEMVVLKLVGASNWYVSSPYLVQTLIYTIISILLSTAILAPLVYLKFTETTKALLGPITEVTISPEVLAIGFGSQLLFGILIVLLSTIMATKRYIPN